MPLVGERVAALQFWIQIVDGASEGVELPHVRCGGCAHEFLEWRSFFSLSKCGCSDRGCVVHRKAPKMGSDGSRPVVFRQKKHGSRRVANVSNSLLGVIQINGTARKGTSKKKSSSKESRKKKTTESNDSPKKQTSGFNEAPSEALNVDSGLGKTGYEEATPQSEAIDEGALQDELDALDFGDDDSSVDDDSVDLR